MFISDVGYADVINDILNEYFQKYFHLATTTWKALKDGGYVETFIYTTHPWLVSMYLDCPPNMVLSGVKLQVGELKTFVVCVVKFDCINDVHGLLG